MRCKALLPLAIGFSVLPLARAAVVYDVSNDFSAVYNPTGVWSYGFTTLFGGPVSLFTSCTTAASGLQEWDAGGGYGSVPGVFHNPYGTMLNDTYSYLPYQVALHPGNAAGLDAVVRFTAPVTGSYTMYSAFSSWVTTTDVHVLRNGTSIYDGLVWYANTSFSTGLTLSQGDTLDFVVGYGGNGHNYDMTGLTATLTLDAPPSDGTGASTPEPAAWILTGFGALAMAAANRLRRRQWGTCQHGAPNPPGAAPGR